MAARLQRRFELDGERLGRLQTVAGGQAVAEGDDAERLGPRRQRGEGQGDHGEKARVWIGNGFPPY